MAKRWRNYIPIFLQIIDIVGSTSSSIDDAWIQQNLHFGGKIFNLISKCKKELPNSEAEIVEGGGILRPICNQIHIL